jgi:hypothetical protein
MTSKELFKKCIVEFRPGYFEVEPTRVTMAFSFDLMVMISYLEESDTVVFSVFTASNTELLYSDWWVGAEEFIDKFKNYLSKLE